MTVKFSLDLSRKIRSCKNKICKACGLYLNQLPVLDETKVSNIFWVGLSAVQFDEGIEGKPLSAHTKSGALIENIEAPLKKEITFYKTNLVKCLPLKDGKIRYPLEHEMEKCFPNFKFELDVLKPSIVFLLGKQVSFFVMKKMGIKEITLSENFQYNTFIINNIIFIPVHHPSYILVYKRKDLNKYVRSIQSYCKKTIAHI
jgi:uracil-DNA glycosylase family 4